MSDLHPEELLDRERSGTLSAGERARLDAHCAVCIACAAERVMMRDFARAESVEPERAEKWVSGALDVLEKAPPSRAAPRGIGIGIAVAALVITAGAAAAYTAVTLGAFESEQATPQEVPAPVAPREPVLAIASDAGVPDAGAPDAGAPDAGENPRASTSPSTAADLFALGNREKRARNAAAALRAFAELERRYPGSNEAQVARVSAGTLLIGRDPRAALQRFDAYLSRGGPLALEAQAGRARALGALGRTAEERAQWERIVREHPSSIHAQRGRDRLEALR